MRAFSQSRCPIRVRGVDCDQPKIDHILHQDIHRGGPEQLSRKRYSLRAGRSADRILAVGKGAGSEIFRTRTNRPWIPSSLLDNGHRVSIPGAKRPGRGADQLFPSSAEVKERAIRLLSLWAFVTFYYDEIARTSLANCYYTMVRSNFYFLCFPLLSCCRSHWPRDLRHGSAAARLLGL